MNLKGDKSTKGQGKKGKTHPDSVDQKWCPWKEKSEAERACCLGENRPLGWVAFQQGF